MRHAVTFSWWLALTMFIFAPAPVTVSSAYADDEIELKSKR